MKKVLSVLCAILLVFAMTTVAFAENVKVPSPVPSGSDVLDIVVADKDGNLLDLVLSIFSISEEDLPEEIKAALDEAAAVFQSAKSIEELLPECAGMEVVDIMSVTVSDEIASSMEEGITISVTLDLKMELPENAKLQIIRFIDGEWVISEDEFVEILEDGTVIAYLNQTGVFALLIG